MKNIYLILIFTLACNFALKAQETKSVIQYDTKVFEGKWEAIDGDFSYEIFFVRKVVKHNVYDFDMILGSIQYIQNGKVIRITAINGFESILQGDVFDKQTLKLRFFDRSRKMNGEVYFKINENKKSASWILEKALYGNSTTSKDWNKSTFDIPSRLEFKKKEIPLAERPLIVPEEEFTPIKAD